MADEPDDIILEHLLYIRRVVDKLDADFEKLDAQVASINETAERIKEMMDRALAQFVYLPAS